MLLLFQEESVFLVVGIEEMGIMGKTWEKEASPAFVFSITQKSFFLAPPINMEYICSVRNKRGTAGEISY